MNPLLATGVATAAPVGSAAAPEPAVFDELAETPEAANALADTLARRAELVLLATQGEQQQLQAKLDRMRATFNAAQEVRSERLRQMNMLRDMAMEQAKADDEILKKYIAMI